MRITFLQTTIAGGETLLFGCAYTRYLVIALQAYFNKAKIAAFGSALLPHINESDGNEKRQVMTNVLREVDSPCFPMQFHICFKMSGGKGGVGRSFLEINRPIVTICLTIRL